MVLRKQTGFPRMCFYVEFHNSKAELLVSDLISSLKCSTFPPDGAVACLRDAVFVSEPTGLREGIQRRSSRERGGLLQCDLPTQLPGVHRQQVVLSYQTRSAQRCFSHETMQNQRGK